MRKYFYNLLSSTEEALHCVQSQMWPLYPCIRINLLGADPRINPFYNDFFNGRCLPVTNPNTRSSDRIPWNVGVLNYQVSKKWTRFYSEDALTLCMAICVRV